MICLAAGGPPFWGLPQSRRHQACGEQGAEKRRARAPGRHARRAPGLVSPLPRHHAPARCPPRPWRLFQSVWDEMRPQGTMRLLLAERRGEVLGGCVMLQLTSTVFYAFNGVRSDALEHRPNDAIHWEAITRPAPRGSCVTTSGRSLNATPASRASRRNGGSQQRRLHRYYFPAPEQPPETGDPDQGPVAQAAAALGDTCRCESQRSPATSPTVFCRSRQHGSPDRPCETERVGPGTRIWDLRMCRPAPP